MTILAIESSCDETSASVLQAGKILSNVIANQTIHELYGGVVPEVASREHQKNIVPVVSEALRQANIQPQDLTAIAFTQGPGLLGSLLVGVSFAKGMALGLGIPLVGVHHMKAHILAHFIDEPKPSFPFLCLTVSGGHTQIVRVESPTDMRVIGETQDDAVGEAFDKTAKLLDLPYPGGPLIDKYAQQGNPKAFEFPTVEMPALNYSFSGIKTSFLNFLKKQTHQNPNFVQENLHDICASVQYTLIDILFRKLKRASRETGIKEIAIAGGVSANSGLRTRLQEEGELLGWNTYIPAFQYCTDNAGMIAMAAYYEYEAGKLASQATQAQARWEIK
ncbi:MAG: tRNA (adenosine(37)-N6)-threonylcarbamoyltransferase complex transferase subunit TsaD [Bacteroidetes bacterium]|nr:MAG: tRNA (adenosine(37)-N6)-threonylcarbamoyltransferase complex transferase subunit TsaD [Bacteroidota bacterium]